MNMIKKNQYNGSFKFLVLITLVTIFICFAGTIACDPPVYFKVENQTNEELFVYLGNREKIQLGTVSPGKIAEMSVFPNPPYPITVTNTQGEVIYSRAFTSSGSLSSSKIVVTTHGTRVE